MIEAILGITVVILLGLWLGEVLKLNNSRSINWWYSMKNRDNKHD